jgi:hypothetical protein
MSVWKLAEIKVMEQSWHYFRKGQREFLRTYPSWKWITRSGKPNVAASVELAGASNSSLSERSRTEEQRSVVYSTTPFSIAPIASQPSTDSYFR